MTSVAFYIVAILAVASAVAVVRTRDVFRAALYVILSFFAVAGIYVTANADFLAVVQILVYVGAMGILLMFGIMLTRDIQQGSPSNRIKGPALVVSLLVMAAMITVVVAQDWEDTTYAVDDLPTVERQVETAEGTTTTEQVSQAVLMPDKELVVDEQGDPVLDDEGQEQYRDTKGSTSYIADALFDRDIGFVLPFEVASVLLLAALIGAVVLVRGKDEE
jgi:NADH:ubiquinone oxidoreductase subunit 6 (subunit J)